MRLKEDDSSWKAQGIKRRDFRHDPHATPEELPKGKNKKNGRQAPPEGWCKGINDNYHVGVLTSCSEWHSFVTYNRRCKNCNKWLGRVTVDRKAA